MTAAYESITDQQMSDATTLVNIVQRVGGAIGATGLVIVLAQTGGPTSSGACTWAFAALTAIATLTLVPAAILPHHGQRQPADDTAEPDPGKPADRYPAASPAHHAPRTHSSRSSPPRHRPATRPRS